MLKQKDLEAAVAAGIISEDQLDELNDFASGRRQARTFAAHHDERFKLLGGLNDFFVAIGIVLLAYAAGLTASSMKLWTMYLVAIFGFWVLAELLTARLKLTAPSIVIAICIALFSYKAGTGIVTEYFLSAVHNNAIQSPVFTNPSGTLLGLWIPTRPTSLFHAIPWLCALFMSVLFYVRFRLPFSVAPIAIAALMSILLLLNVIPGIWDVIPRNIVFLIYGLALFFLALTCDSSDTERLTRRADKGFWLHAVAASLIVHPLIVLLTGNSVTTGWAALVTIVTVFILALVALIVDRRALVVVSLAYIGAAIAYTVKELSGAQLIVESMVLTMFILGGLIVVLGVGWHPIRRRLINALPDFNFKQKVPPVK